MLKEIRRYIENDSRTLNNIFLTDPETGEMLVICSLVKTNGNETSFEARNLGTKKDWKITFRIEECENQ